MDGTDDGPTRYNTINPVNSFFMESLEKFCPASYIVEVTNATKLFQELRQNVPFFKSFKIKSLKV